MLLPEVRQLTGQREGLKELSGLRKLARVLLISTPVTDVGLKALSGLKTLSEVDLSDAKTTDDGPDAKCC